MSTAAFLSWPIVVLRVNIAVRAKNTPSITVRSMFVLKSGRNYKKVHSRDKIASSTITKACFIMKPRTPTKSMPAAVTFVTSQISPRSGFLAILSILQERERIPLDLVDNFCSLQHRGCRDTLKHLRGKGLIT